MGDVVEVLGTTKIAEALFKMWWELYGQHFEEECGFSVTKREISAYAFEAGFLTGRRVETWQKRKP